MSPSLLHFLSEFSWGAHSIAIIVTGVACLRLSKRGADKLFAPAAWLALAGILLLCLPWLLSWVLVYLSISPTWWGYMIHVANFSDLLLFGHLILFVAAAFRTAHRLPARIQPEQITPEPQLPSD